MTTVPPQRDRSRAVIQVVSRSDLSRTIMAASLAPADLGDDGTMIGLGLRSGREPVNTTRPRASMVDGQAQRPRQEGRPAALPTRYNIKAGLRAEGVGRGRTVRR